MGNSHSDAVDSVQVYSAPAYSMYSKFINFYQLPNKISKTEFLKILQKLDESFAKILTDYYAAINNSDEIIEHDFNDIMENLCFKSSEALLTYLMKILGINSQITNEQIKLLMSWISLSSSVEFCDIIINSFIKSNNNESMNIFDTEKFISWINRNFPDLGLDFSRLFYNVLTSNCNEESYSIGAQLVCTETINQLNSSIISLYELFALFSCLPSIYKSSEHIEEYSFQNSLHWFMLYNSDKQGLSSSKLKETSFDYNGPLLVFFKSKSGIYCLASDSGLKEDWNSYGGVYSQFMQLRPFYQKYISGSRSQTPNSGIIYSHFSAKSGRRGLFVGHNPLARPALELNEDFNSISVLGRLEQLVTIEVWAVGCDVLAKTAKLQDIRHWEKNEVDKNKNRKLKPSDWKNNPDRELLNWGGVNVHNTDLIGGIEQEQHK